MFGIVDSRADGSEMSRLVEEHREGGKPNIYTSHLSGLNSSLLFGAAWGSPDMPLKACGYVDDWSHANLG